MKMFLLLALFICIAGCQYPPDYIDFRKMSENKQREEFRKFSIEKQVDFYLYSMSREPPDSKFADDIAKQGKEVIPYLLDRIRKEQDYRKVDLLYMFEVMSKNYVELRKEAKVIKALEEVVTKMKGSAWRTRAEESLNYIKGRRSDDVIGCNNAAPNNGINRTRSQRLSSL